MNQILYILIISLIFPQPTIDWFQQFNGSGEESQWSFYFRM